MQYISHVLARLWASRGGTITILAAVAVPVVLAASALAVDYSSLLLQRRNLQQNADLAAISAASDITNGETALLGYFTLNQRKLVVRSGSTLITPNGTVAYSDKVAFSDNRGYAELVRGRYFEDATIAPAQRFVAAATPFDAVKVTIYQAGDLSLATPLMGSSAPRLQAIGVASVKKVAAFSIGSRLASVNQGVINSMLGAMLGTTLNLSLVDYQSMLGANINAVDFANAVATQVGITAVSYDTLLATQVKFDDILAALLKIPGQTAATTSAITKLRNSLGTTPIKLPLNQMMNLDGYRYQVVGTLSGVTINTDIFSVIGAAANVASAGKTLSIDLGTTLPGLGATTLTLAVGQPTVNMPAMQAGKVGAVGRTSQTRLNIVTNIDGLAAIAGLKVRIPIYVNVANGEAALSSITCYGGTADNADIGITALPGVFSMALGEIDTTKIADFSKTPTVSQTTLLHTLLIDANVSAYAAATNISPKLLTFSANETRAGTIKTVATKDSLATVTSSLLTNLNINLSLIGITLGTPTVVNKAIADTVAKAISPVDDLLFNSLGVLGVKIGEMDVRASNVNCRSPALIN